MTKPEKRVPHRRKCWCTTEKSDSVGSPASGLEGSFCRAFFMVRLFFCVAAFGVLDVEKQERARM